MEPVFSGLKILLFMRQGNAPNRWDLRGGRGVCSTHCVPTSQFFGSYLSLTQLALYWLQGKDLPDQRAPSSPHPRQASSPNFTKSVQPRLSSSWKIGDTPDIYFSRYIGNHLSLIPELYQEWSASLDKRLPFTQILSLIHMTNNLPHPQWPLSIKTLLCANTFLLFFGGNYFVRSTDLKSVRSSERHVSPYILEQNLPAMIPGQRGGVGPFSKGLPSPLNPSTKNVPLQIYADSLIYK